MYLVCPVVPKPLYLSRCEVILTCHQADRKKALPFEKHTANYKMLISWNYQLAGRSNNEALEREGTRLCQIWL